MSEKTFIHEDNIFSSLILKNEKDIISQKTNLYTEEELLNLLSEQIQHLMVHDREQLWSLFYRLDINIISFTEIQLNPKLIDSTFVLQ